MIHTVLNLGTSIEITFKSGEGLEANRTRIKYKDIDIGIVKSIELTAERDVLVKAEITPKAKHLIVEDTRFWVVRPRITGGLALGLGTILTGAHIAMDPGKSSDSRRTFAGLENPPATTADDPGRQFILRAADLGSVDVGTPVYFRRVRVGKTVSTELDPNGKGVVVRVFVNAPYDRYVTAATRFWDVSGVEVALDSGGFRLETESLTAIVIGGIAFEAPPDAPAAAPAQPDADFTLHPNRDAAMKQLYTVKDTYILYFNHSVRGLTVGSPVDFLGVEIGEVTSIKLDYNRAQGTMRPAVEITIYPERLSARFRERGPAYDPGRRAESLQRFVDRGLRAQTAHRKPAHRAGLRLAQFLPQGAEGQDRPHQGSPRDSHRARRIRGAADGGDQRGEGTGEGSVRRSGRGFPQGCRFAGRHAEGSEHARHADAHRACAGVAGDARGSARDARSGRRACSRRTPRCKAICAPRCAT